jgi:hypothetical protein
VAGDVDVIVRRGQVHSLPSNLDSAGCGFWAEGGEACHFLEKVGAFLVRDGREIVVDPVAGVEDRVLRLSILGPALALVLHQRGLFVLHASAVSRDGVAMAFLGRHGWGKSTIAAALHARGYDLVTDDVAAVALGPDGPCIVPSFPQMKLWPEAATLLGESPERLPILHPSFDKRGWRASRGFTSEPRRLERLYVIAAGPVPAVEPLQPREACLELLSHWYGHRFGSGLLKGDAAAAHLRQCVALADRVPMRRLRRSGGPSTLLELAALVDDDLGRDSRLPPRLEPAGTASPR